MSSDPKWVKFEKLVAQLHESSQKGAQVIWNEVISGRQFDVTIRFKVGYYNYLVVIECRDQSSAVPVSDVEAFVTKSDDVGANKAIMASSSGFQSGAIVVANKHNLELFTLSEINEFPEDMLSDIIEPALFFYDFCFKLKDTKLIYLPEDKNLPEYLMQNLIIIDKNGRINLNKLLERNRQKIVSLATDRERVFPIKFYQKTSVYFPHLCEEHLIEKLSFKYQIAPSRRLREQSSLDPHFLKYRYKYTNELTGEEYKLKKTVIDTNFNTTITQGKFYFDPNLEFSYYIKSINGENLNFIMVESYQHGELLQIAGKVKIDVFQKTLVEITDNNEIERLKKVGEKVFEHQGISF